MIKIFAAIVVAMRLVFLFRIFNTPRKPAILGVYQQRNKYYFIKFIFIFVILKIRQLINHVKRFLSADREKLYDGTLHVQKEDLLLEEKFAMGDFPKAIDAVYFNGLSQDGAAVICGIARRPQNFCDSFLYLKLSGEELLLSPSLPDTHQKQAATEEGEYSAEGLTAVKYMPMRTWNVSYDGQMKSRSSPDKKVPVQAKLVWSANYGAFNYDTQMSARSLAADMARETWSRDYFNLLKKFHQTHYEQMGVITGTVTVAGKHHSIRMPCVRDHSFGPFRDWRTFHRYVLHFVFLENGDCLSVGAVSQPAVLSHLTIGYYCRKKDQKVFPVSGSDFQLYQHGEAGQMPKDYGFSFQVDGETYIARFKVEDEDQFFIGEDRVSKFYERWGTVEINGVNGWACAEWQYNNELDKNEPKKLH